MKFTVRLRPVAKKQPSKRAFANALREAGRSCERGMATDEAALAALFAEWSTERPLDGMHVRKLLDDIQAAVTRGDRHATVGQLRAAIDFVTKREKAEREAAKGKNGT